MTIYNTKIVKIGNSQGIRIPKLLLEQTSIGEDVELVAEDGNLIIRAAGNPRSGWDQAFKSMAERNDDKLLDQAIVDHEWDEENWEW